MVISDDIGKPLMVEFKTVLAFYMHGQIPVAVEVKPVVIGAAAGPYFVVLAVVRVGNERSCFVLIDPTHKTVATVGIQNGFDKNEGFVQEFFCFVVFAGRQIVSRQNHRFTARGFVAVDIGPKLHQNGHFGHIG